MAKKNLKGMFHKQAAKGCLRGTEARRLSEDGFRRFGSRVVPSGKGYQRKDKHGSKYGLGLGLAHYA